MSKHPLKKLLLDSHREKLAKLAHDVNLLPISLPRISETKIEGAVITRWMEEKNFFE